MPHIADQYILYDGTTRADQIVVNVNPGAGLGTPAVIGTIAQYNDGAVGRVYLKDGPLDTDWTELVFGDHQAPTFIVGNQAAGDGPGECDYLETGLGTAIQDAINALPATGGWIHVKRGTYNNAATLLVPEYVKITGDGYATEILNSTGGGGGAPVIDVAPVATSFIYNWFEGFRSSIGSDAIFRVATDGFLMIKGVHTEGNQHTILELNNPVDPPTDDKSGMYLLEGYAESFDTVVSYFGGSEMNHLVVQNYSFVEGNTIFDENGQWFRKTLLTGCTHKTTFGKVLSGTFQFEESFIVISENVFDVFESAQMGAGVAPMAQFAFRNNHWHIFNGTFFQFNGWIRGLTIDGDKYSDPFMFGQGINIQGERPAGPDKNDVLITNVDVDIIIVTDVTGLQVTQTTTSGIAVQSCSEVQIYDNDFKQAAGMGAPNGCVEINSMGSGGLRSGDVMITNNRMHWLGIGVYLTDSPEGNVLISGNEFGHRNNMPGFGAMGIQQVNADVALGSYVIDNNTFTNLDHAVALATGFGGNGPEHFTFSNNFLFGCSDGFVGDGVVHLTQGGIGIVITGNTWNVCQQVLFYAGILDQFTFTHNSCNFTTVGASVVIRDPNSGLHANLIITDNNIGAGGNAIQLYELQTGTAQNAVIANNNIWFTQGNYVIEGEFRKSMICGNTIFGPVATAGIYLHDANGGSEDTLIANNIINTTGPAPSIQLAAGCTETRVVYNFIGSGFNDLSGGPTVVAGNWT